MTDETLDYSKRNPRILLGEKAVSQIKENPNAKAEELNAPIVMLYQADGSPTPYVRPTREQTGALLDVIMEHVAGMDIRAIMKMLEDIDQAISAALIQTLNAAHAVAHIEEKRGNYDEKLLCDGTMAYLDPNQHFDEPHEEITAETVVNDMLANIFNDPKKLH